MESTFYMKQAGCHLEFPFYGSDQSGLEVYLVMPRTDTGSNGPSLLTNLQSKIEEFWQISLLVSFT